jgi:hypothetical protein
MLPLIVIGGLVLASMIVMLMLFIFSGLVWFPVSLVFLTVTAGLTALAVALLAASYSRRKKDGE